MIENLKVSIIIPVYNTRKYFDRCIKSVINQSYNNLDIIIVDDGSCDGSEMQCDYFASQDKRIKILHKKNCGLSSARNEGIEIATGEFITFVDSDDYLSCNCIEKLLNMCLNTNSDIAVIKMMCISENTNEEIISIEKEYIRVLNKEDAIEASLYQILYSCCAPAKLYNKSVLVGIQFPVGKLSEDLATCHLFFNNANKIAYTNKVGYFYRQRASSIMHVFNPQRLDALVWTNNIEKFCGEKYSRIVQAAKCRTFNIAVHLALDIPDSGDIHDKYFSAIWKEVKRTRIHTITCNKARGREKAAAFLSFGGEKLLKRVWNSRLAIKQKEEERK